ncbi:MAG: ribonuclease H family protein [Candidatus Thiodiazotropha sp.]
MGARRQQYNFYAVTNGKETGVYTSWTQAGDSVLGFAKAKYKGFCTFREATLAMLNAGFLDFNVFDGQHTYKKSEYEQNRLKQLAASEAEPADQQGTQSESDLEFQTCIKEVENYEEQESLEKNLVSALTHTVYIDGSCIRNGSSSAQAGIGLYWGNEHAWNYSQPIQDDAPTNNKAEMRAAIKAIEIAKEHEIENLIIKSDSKYVIQGITEWVHKWGANGWKTSNGEDVKNKEIWIELLSVMHDSEVSITWEHVAAHSGILENEEADRLATEAAKRMQQHNDKDWEYSPGIAPSEQPEKQTIPNIKPKVIIIPKRNANTNESTSAKQPQCSVQTTPKRKIIRDKDETPVPGSVNGSSFSEEKKTQPRETNMKCKPGLMDNELTVKCITNVEAVLQTVMSEIHELRQHQLDFKKEVTEQLNNLQIKQQGMEKSIASFSNDITMEINSCINKVDGFKSIPRQEHQSNSSYDIQPEIKDLHKKVDSQFIDVKTVFRRSTCLLLHCLVVWNTCQGTARQTFKIWIPKQSI